MTQFKTIRQTAAMGILPEHRIRILVAQGKCPGVYSGTRFLVNTRLLEEMLDRESATAVKEDT